MGDVKTYLIHYVNKSSDVIPSQTPNSIRYPPAREDLIDKGWEFTLRESTADQAP